MERVWAKKRLTKSISLHVAENSARLRALESDLSFPPECVDQRPWGIRSRGLCVFTDVLGIADLLVVWVAANMPYREPEAAERQVGLDQMLLTQV
jgi:hypothetical protein